MGFNVYGFLAVIFLLLGIATVGALVFFKVQKTQYKVGDLVRTSFSACPAVLTTALWGSHSRYDSLQTYGFNFGQDAANALHCDMAQGSGLYSTWISDGGQNFYYNRSITEGSTFINYVVQKECTTTADCSLSTIQCGPGVKTPNTGLDKDGNKVLGDRTLWDPSEANPASAQCPSSAYCDICNTPVPPNLIRNDTYCMNARNSKDAIGNCINAVGDNGYSISCQTHFKDSDIRFCVGVNEPSADSPPFNRLVSCSTNTNYPNLFFSITQNNGTTYESVQCSDATSGAPKPYQIPAFCYYNGNASCFQGQTCVQNFGVGPNYSSTGWKTESGGDPKYRFASHVCSGTIYPNTALKTDWIAEGRIRKIGKATGIDVEWERIQNTYPGVGPSDLWCSDTTNCFESRNKNNGAAFYDNSWIYSDCRFLKAESISNNSNSRHYHISKALLGDATTNPLGLGLLSVSINNATDSYFTNIDLLTLLYVGKTQGTITDNFQSYANSLLEYKQSAWTLRSLGLREADLEKIFFYSIYPIQTNDTVLQHHTFNHTVVKNKLNLTGRIA